MRDAGCERRHGRRRGRGAARAIGRHMAWRDGPTYAPGRAGGGLCG